MTKAQAVRDAALALHAAITEAVSAGCAVQWPRRAEDLPAIAVSDTARVPEAVPAPKPRRKKSAPDAE